MKGLEQQLVAFYRGQVLRRSDLHLANVLLRLGAEDRVEVGLAAAMAARAPRHGHVCVDLRDVRDRVVPVAAEGEDAPVLTWPAFSEWMRELGASRLTRGPTDPGDTPLVLDGPRLYLDRYWRYQLRLMRALEQRTAGPELDVDENILREGIESLFPRQAGQALDRQRLGAVMAVLRRLTVISGGPGTGKTTTITRILALLYQQAERAGSPLRVALAAPTGKAANRVKESIDAELARLPLDDEMKSELAQTPSFTLHRLLGWKRRNPTRFWHDADNQLPYDVVVIDEASMVSFAMMAKLVDAVPPDARLILLGDRDQLTSVEAGAVLGDVCNPTGGELRFSRIFADRVSAITGDDLSVAERVDQPGIWDCMVQLDRFYRFGEASGIGGVARAIQRDRADDVVAYLSGAATESGEGHYDDVELLELGDEGQLPASCRRSIVDGYARFVRIALGTTTGEDALEALGSLRVLCGHRRGPLGVEMLNQRIESWLEAEIPGFDPTRTWYLGRPVIVTENDYGLRLFNGDVGVVIEVEGRRVVAFRKPGGEVRLISPSRLPPVETVFAMSIHKSQGSQFDHAVVVLPSERSLIVTRELVYTGVTRARSRMSLIAKEQVLRDAIAEPVRRASGLRAKLWPGLSTPRGATKPLEPDSAREGPDQKAAQLSLFDE
jgi:exodeoxyribonuclease V alpha subunit